MIDRRNFLTIVGCVAATPACSAAAVPAANVGDIAGGTESALAPGSLMAIPGEPACVARDVNGIYAMTLICTHQGCDMGRQGTVSGHGLYCGCHGSSFDVDGNVLSGPAPAPLAHFAVSSDTSGNLTVHTGTEVDPSTRLAVG